jgi:hypothetical protein
MNQVLDKPQGTHKHGLDSAFDLFDAALRLHAGSFAGRPLFRTNVTDLFDSYLAGFADPVERQYHNCSCCRHFLNHYGSLAVIVDGAVGLVLRRGFTKALLRVTIGGIATDYAINGWE